MSQQIEDARGRVDALKSAILEGGKVTAKQLADARAELDLAELQVEAEEQREAERREAERRAHLEALRERAAERQLEAKAIEAHRLRAEEAVNAYIEAVALYQTGLHDLTDALMAGAFNPDSGHAPVEGIKVTLASGGTPLQIGDLAVPSLAPRHTIERVVREALARYFPRGVE